MLRVFLPALQVGPGLTGVGTYTLELVRAMSTLPTEDLEFFVGAAHPDCFEFLEGRKGWQVVRLGLTRDDPWGRMLANHTIVPQAAHRVRARLVLAPNFVAPIWGRFDTAVMVHDLTFVHFPWTTTRAKRTYYRLMVRRSVRRARRVFVSTRTVGRELREFVPEAGSKLRLTPEGVAPAFLANVDEEAGTRGGSLPWMPARRDFLFVGTLEPRKNLARVLAAHGNLCRQDPDFPTLRLLGGKGWEDHSIRTALREHPAPDRVLLLGYRSVEELRAEYDQALALIFPSLYEGFGLPVLEAMARSCPVLTSRGTATEEVSGGAALLVDPFETGSIEAAMARLARDRQLRDRLAEHGRRRVEDFSWRICAERTLEGLRELAPCSRGAEG